ncbi:hypothetical protein HRbin37_01110 [bacterium HR37]|nr:hypothetical protein HRbin37_01110 [bacterium HR37]
MRIGTTSYIFPDRIIPNVERLANLVDDIELVLFEGKDYSNLPTDEEIKTLKKLSKEFQISYTVHLPIDLDICSPDNEFRKFSVTRITDIIKLTLPLNPNAYILHLPRNHIQQYEEKWFRNTRESLSYLFAEFGSDNIAIENLSYPVKYILPIIREFDFRLCLDISHALSCKDKWEDIINENFDRIDVIHLYAHRGEEHVGLQRAKRGFVESVISKILSLGFSGILTLEVFSEEDFFESKRIVEEVISAWKERFLLPEE